MMEDDYSDEDPDYNPLAGYHEADDAADTISVAAGPSHFRSLIEHLGHSLEPFQCDASLVCSDGEALKCHKLVLAAISPSLKVAMDEEGDSVVLLPDLPSNVVGAFLEDVYGASTGDKWVEAERMAELEAVSKALDVDRRLWQCLNEVVVKKEEESMYDGDYAAPDDEDELDEKKVLPSKPRKRRGRPPKAVSEAKKAKTEDSEEVLDEGRLQMIMKEADSLNSLMCKVDRQQLTVKVVPNKQEEQFLKSVLPTKNYFMAVLGLKKSAEGEILAKPFNWSCLDESNLLSAFQTYADALKAVLGFSNLELYGQQAVRVGMGLKRQGGSRRNKLKQDLAALSKEQLDEVLSRDDVAKAGLRGQNRSGQSDLSHCREIKLTLVNNLELDDVTDLLVLRLDEGLRIVGHLCDFDAETDKARDALGQDYVRLFFKVFLTRSGHGHAQVCPKLLKLFEYHMPLKLKFEVSREFLSDDSGSKRKGFIKDEQCPDCGEVFPIRTTADKAKYGNHKRNHYFMNYQCDCPVTWADSLNAKRAHVMLVHLPGNEQCPHCSYVAGPKAVASHIYSFHTDMTCEHCGAVLSGAERLNDHTQRAHPEQMSEKLKKRKSPGGTCEYCGEHFTNLRKHEMLMHTKKADIECPHCGITFKENKRLKMHVLNVHTPKEQLPFQCEHCDRK